MPKKLTHLARHRRYYEHLSLAHEEILKKRRPSPSLDYLERYKTEVYYPMILRHLYEKRRFQFKEPWVIDVGCGPGKDILAIAFKRSLRGCGVDLSLNNLRLAQKRGRFFKGRIFWVQSAIEHLPFLEGRFDCALTSEVIEHLLDPGGALSEIRRVLKPKGLLFLTTPNRYSYFTLLSEILPKRIKSALSRFVWGLERDYKASRHYLDDPGVAMHVREFGPLALAGLLKENGFQLLEMKGGALAVPLPSLFDRWKSLLAFWRFLDRMLSFLPGSCVLKENIVAAAIKI